MWKTHFITLRRPLRCRDLRASTLASVEKPLAKLGFQPIQHILVLTPHPRAYNAYTFVRGDGRLSLYFSRATPYSFQYQSGSQRYRSPGFETIEELETALAKYLKIPPFSPEKRPVIDWPARKPVVLQE